MINVNKSFSSLPLYFLNNDMGTEALCLRP